MRLDLIRTRTDCVARRKKGNRIDGWVVLDKPLDMTSTKAVSRVRYLLNAQKAGHAGTLDPLATGILPIALGEATKTVPFVMDGIKIYRFTVCWGVETRTDDGEGAVVATSDQRPSKEQISALLPRFSGEIMQVPPAFSAIKVDGERAYDIARDGEDVLLAARPVHIRRLDLVALEGTDRAVFETECGKGTYVRALARDMGRELGCFGHVCALRRTKVGPFTEKDMISLEKIEELSHSPAGQASSETDFGAELASKLDQVLRPVETALDDIPALAISRSDAARLRNGQPVLVRGRDAPVHSGPVYAICAGALVALGDMQHGELHPTRVFNLAAPAGAAAKN